MTRMVAALAIGLGLGSACSLFTADVREPVEDTAAKLLHCQEEARQAPDGGHLAAYEACKKDAGLE